MGYIAPEYGWVDMPNVHAPGGYEKKQVVVRPGYTDMSAEYEYQAKMNQIALLQNLMNQMQAPQTTDTGAIASNYYAMNGAQDVADALAEGARSGADRGSFYGGLVGGIQQAGKRQAADYAANMANTAYRNNLDRIGSLAGIIGNMGDYSVSAARSRGDMATGYNAQSAYNSFKPYNPSGSGASRFLNPAMQALGGAIATAPDWMPTAKKGLNWAGNVAKKTLDWIF